MKLFDLKPLAIKIIFSCTVAFLLGTSKFLYLFKAFKDAALVLIPIVIILIALMMISAAILAGGVSLFFNKIFFRKDYRIGLDLFVGAFSLLTFFAILIKLPTGSAHFWAMFILPVANLLLILKFSHWLHTDQNLSLPLAIVYGNIMFFCNFNNFLGFLNRFNYWEGEHSASWGVWFIFTWPIAIVISISYMIYIDRKKSRTEQAMEK